jgi:hypothetical protein
MIWLNDNCSKMGCIFRPKTNKQINAGRYEKNAGRSNKKYAFTLKRDYPEIGDNIFEPMNYCNFYLRICIRYSIFENAE